MHPDDVEKRNTISADPKPSLISTKPPQRPSSALDVNAAIKKQISMQESRTDDKSVNGGSIGITIAKNNPNAHEFTSDTVMY